MNLPQFGSSCLPQTNSGSDTSPFPENSKHLLSGTTALPLWNPAVFFYDPLTRHKIDQPTLERRPGEVEREPRKPRTSNRQGGRQPRRQKAIEDVIRDLTLLSRTR